MYTYPLTIEGTLRFDPIPAKRSKPRDPWWLILTCDDEWVRYYQWLLFRETGIRVHRPRFGAHLSVIRGEEPLDNKFFWKTQEGGTRTAQLAVSMRSTEDGSYWWLDAQSEGLSDLRHYYGLPRPQQGFHLTIGRV